MTAKKMVVAKSIKNGKHTKMQCQEVKMLAKEKEKNWRLERKMMPSPPKESSKQIGTHTKEMVAVIKMPVSKKEKKSG